ncbi:PDZ domain-containing protein [Paenibacillus abyssi]|uniref:PDZ domain-containing protein n=1 Tax=Paenibacillus abyssi TaxID=1340531 RepID=A0A917FW90_9BACL|nr:PDZ domain-containing protein [Paenibacillus abyssi]GGG06661.1 hypothetical protein GCM10010916_24490 [Paenibacillus abyssi]
MRRWQQMYVYGMAAAILLFVLGELIWLPDRFRFGPSLYLIDLLDSLIYLLLIPPMLWMVASIDGIIAARKETAAFMAEARGRGKFMKGLSKILYGDVLRRGLTLIVSGAAAAILIVMGASKELTLSLTVSFIVMMGCGWLLAIWDICAYEWRRRPRILPWRGLSGLLLSCAILWALFWPTSNLVTYPGVTVNMNRYAVVEGGVVKGEILGLLVFDRPAFPADWLYAKLFPHYVFRPIERLGMPIGSYESLVRNMKMEADELGSAVAFQAAGIGRGATSHGAMVLNVEVDGPAYGYLRPGDVIIELNGESVVSTLDLRDRMRPVQPGAYVQLKVLRAGAEQSLRIETVEHPDYPGRSAFGIQVMDDLILDLPRKVEFRSYFAHEGGPSHGAALALTLLDQLTPGGVTRGNRVFVTGTIQADGAVGRIGGLRQKAFTAARAGADVFFVPRGQEETARLGAPQLNIVPVGSLNDMLEWLADNPK